MRGLKKKIIRVVLSFFISLSIFSVIAYISGRLSFDLFMKLMFFSAINAYLSFLTFEKKS